MKDVGEAKRLYTHSAYRRAADGDFTSLRKTRVSARDVMSAAIQADAALISIQHSLREMRRICESYLDGGNSDEKFSREKEFEALKENISRLAETFSGAKFPALSLNCDKGAESLSEINRSLDEVSRLRKSIASPSSGDDEKLSSWIKSILVH